MTEKGGFVLSYLMSVLVSVMLLETGLGLFVFAIPLLLFAGRVNSQKTAISVFIAAFAGILLIRMYSIGWFIKENIGLFLMDILLPTMVLAECALYVFYRNKSELVLRRLVLSSRLPVVIGLVFATFINSQAGADVFEGIIEGLAPGFVYVDEMLGVNSASVLPVYVRFLYVPTCLILGGLQIWMSENALHKMDDDWQMGFAYMKMPDSYVWLFFGFWIAVILCGLIKSIPLWLYSDVLILALAVSLHYLMNGVSVLTAKLRRGSVYLTSGRVCLMVIVLSIIPFVGFFVFLGLTVTGVLETWVKMR